MIYNRKQVKAIKDAADAFTRALDDAGCGFDQYYCDFDGRMRLLVDFYRRDNGYWSTEDKDQEAEEREAIEEIERLEANRPNPRFVECWDDTELKAAIARDFDFTKG